MQAPDPLPLSVERIEPAKQTAVVIDDGPILLGYVSQVGDHWHARLANGISLGLYGSQADARAVVESVGRRIG